MDFETLASRIGLDGEDFRELAELFIITTRSDMDKIEQAMSAANPADAAAAAHSIKGAAGNLGFDEIAKLAKTMESRGNNGNLDGFDNCLVRMADHLKDVENQLTGA